MTDLLTISHRYGRDPKFVLAGGGNTSIKTADRLWVKASGTSLATITEGGFVEMDRVKLQRILDDDRWPDDPAAREAEFQRRVAEARVHPELNQRPSVEVLLHHLMPQRLVVHTHPTVVNAVTCCTAGQRIAGVRAGLKFVWQPYVDPGWVLGRCVWLTVQATLKNLGWQASVVLLQNHGLVVAGDTVDEIEGITSTIVNGFPSPPEPFEAVPQETELRAWREVIQTVNPGCSVATDSSPPIRWMTDTAAGKAAALAGPLTPDQIVYARSFPLWIDGRASAELLRIGWSRYTDRYGFEPWVILIAGVGVVAVRMSSKLAEITRAVYADAATICHAAHELGGVQTLSTEDRQFIENWEVEAYRRGVSQEEKLKTDENR